MKIKIAKNYDDLYHKAADCIEAQIREKPDSVIGYATGATMIGIYKILCERCQNGELDFSKTTALCLDEFQGVSKDTPYSYYHFMDTYLFKHCNIKKENIHAPDGMAKNAVLECSRYNHLFESLGGVDLQILGIGLNGHIGSNEPGTKFEKETHCVKLALKTIQKNRILFGEKNLPKKAYTVGIQSIMKARRILLVAKGKEKADVIHELIYGPITPKLPVSILQLHHDTELIGDLDALERI